MLPGVGARLRRLLLVVVLVGGACGVANGAAYDDFARGISANLQGDPALAVSSFSAALAAGDLNPTLLPAAYRGRAIAYLRQGQCKNALADLDDFLRLKPGDLQGLELRGRAHACTGDMRGAEADLSQAIAVQSSESLRFARGVVRWGLRDFAGSAADFADIIAAQPHNANVVLWLELVRTRGGILDAKIGERDLHGIDSDDWPAPLIKMFLGAAKPEDVAAAALHGDANVVSGRQCEANFYIAEWWLAQKDTASAKPLLEAAIKDCPKNFIEAEAARSELGTLK
jgi:tetratricopeptide (TPR) repeat protein